MEKIKYAAAENAIHTIREVKNISRVTKQAAAITRVKRGHELAEERSPENSMLFFLSALFLKLYFDHDRFTGKQMLQLALVFSAIALTRMDAVLMFIPVIVYVYLAKREKTSFFNAVWITPYFLSAQKNS